MVIARWQVKNRAFLAILSRANHATGFGVESLLPLTQHFQTMFGRSAAMLVSRSTHRNIHDGARSVRQYFSMTGSKRVFLGCWVSLDEQDRLCEVSLDRSATKEVSGPSEQQIDSIFQACKSCTNPTINKLLTRLLSAISESRSAVKEMHPLILSSYSTTSPPLPSRLMSKHRPKLLNDPRNVLDQGATRGWWHGARAEPGKAL